MRGAWRGQARGAMVGDTDEAVSGGHRGAAEALSGSEELGWKWDGTTRRTRGGAGTGEKDGNSHHSKLRNKLCEALEVVL
ncbi:unnamed protein product [Thlaspi arvense]|uniref:Uncharacterized protein n=1 Tax=Thlaspi arvense TaxID=13288 RepID=A0AAU9S8F1_THLAR|nr:unnamed protein product [Thlaspi arvense]